MNTVLACVASAMVGGAVAVALVNEKLRDVAFREAIVLRFEVANDAWLDAHQAANAAAAYDHTGEVLSVTSEPAVVAVVAAAVPVPPWCGPLTSGSSLPHVLLLHPTPTTEEPTMDRPTTPDQPPTGDGPPPTPYRGRHWHAGDKTSAYPIVVPAETRELVGAVS